jgi:hypothetical protein
MNERINPESEAHALALGRYWIDRDPLNLLKELRASIGYRAGYCIYLTEYQMKRIDEVIAFNEGRQN